MPAPVHSDAPVPGDLAAIRALMEDSQRFLAGTWKHHVVWGVLSAVGLLATWLALVAGASALAYVTWPVVLAVGWTLSIVMGRRHKRRTPVRTTTLRGIAGIWVGLGVTLTLMGTLGLYAGAVHPAALPGLLSLTLGAAYFATGQLARMPWLSGVGAAWWVAGAALLVWRGPWGLPVLAALVLLLEVAPGLELRRREARPRA